jgi:hypothetical protein
MLILSKQTIALDTVYALNKRVKAAQKEKIALRDEVLRLRAEREQVALRMDAVRIKHEDESKSALVRHCFPHRMWISDCSADTGHSIPWAFPLPCMAST